MMKNIFDEALKLNSEITKISGKCDIIGIEVNTAMQAYQDCKDEKVGERFLGRRYLELAEMLAEYGLITKEWKDKEEKSEIKIINEDDEPN